MHVATLLVDPAFQNCDVVYCQSGGAFVCKIMISVLDVGCFVHLHCATNLNQPTDVAQRARSSRRVSVACHEFAEVELARTGVDKHFLRRATLKALSLLGAACATIAYFSYNLRFVKKVTAATFG